MAMRERVVVALDLEDWDEAVRLASALSGRIGLFKIGISIFSKKGPEAIRRISEYGPVFYDAKFMDIPNTVAGAAKAVTSIGVRMFNVHALGGPEMMRAAVDASYMEAESLGIPRPKVLGVTMLTSIDQQILEGMGIRGDLGDIVLKLAELAKGAGLDGVVASAWETRRIKEELGKDFIVLVPGIRPSWERMDDQRRVATPQDAIAQGADYIVLGRAITRARDPIEALERVIEELKGH
jgi:orotidine-5'-phosphate decarboxylase